MEDGVTLTTPTNVDSREPVTLAAIMDLPLDILYEIFKHMHPADLLYLTQSSKALRHTLLRRGAKSTWEYSLKAASYPMIPPCIDNGMSLPQYTNLIYGSNCFACGSTLDVISFFEFLDKRCEGCVLEKYCMLLDWKWGNSAPFDPETGYPGSMVRWDIDYGDWETYTYLVDKEDFARIDADLAGLSKGDAEDSKKYIDGIKAKTQRAREFQETIHGVLRSEGYVLMM
ncbi:hypothetical protein K525DRAFT_215063 [Schizophyllum commune Loenen D]|nr:hypothetical protein K525DRAFT_215063 [Schizophyllum commune Loenen D]